MYEEEIKCRKQLMVIIVDNVGGYICKLHLIHVINLCKNAFQLQLERLERYEVDVGRNDILLGGEKRLRY